jgi:hypothetical protein
MIIVSASNYNGISAKITMVTSYETVGNLYIATSIKKMSENNSLKYNHVGTRFEALSSMNLAVIIDCALDRWLALKNIVYP